jgi:hypothetical protein
MVEWLLSIGADPSIRDGLVDIDAAGWAIHHGHIELVQLFGGVKHVGLRYRMSTYSNFCAKQTLTFP